MQRVNPSRHHKFLSSHLKRMHTETNTVDVKSETSTGPGVHASPSLSTHSTELKVKKKKNGNGDLNELRDEYGFKLKVQDVDSLMHKQIDPEYEVIIDGPLRRIVPYYFTYKTFCKLRWRNKRLLDIFTEEFRDRDKEYYRKTISNGSVYLNGSPATLETIVHNGDLIMHKIHRHEPAVSSRAIKIVYEDENILAIDKPSGIPVHPTGRFRFNTITKILEKQLGYPVHPCNRLDRLTSGLMFLAKTPKAADKMAEQMKAREVSKEYIARVVGEFPIDEIVVEEPIKTIEPKLGLNAVCSLDDEDAKVSKTIFKRISYDGETSIVKCKPFTGRTHQIRVHLQYLGYPIANDPIYSNPQIWGPGLGKGHNINYLEVIEKLNEIGKTAFAESWYHPSSQGEVLKNEKCSKCETELYTDPGPNDLDLWLHAYRYESTELDEHDKKLWSYQTSFPEWALDPHHRYMNLAIKEAQKCEPTNKAFNVGAILVNGTEIISTGYSRELPGNTHAEECALEKYFQKTGNSIVPPGTILYTTMEPCSLRLSGYRSCTDRIIDMNCNIQTVFVGMIEPSTFVNKNIGESKLSQKNISYIVIPGYEDQARLIAFKGHECHA